MPRLSVHLPSRPESLSVLRRRLRTYLQDMGLDETVRHELTIAASEAAPDAIEHAQSPSADGIEVEAVVQDGEAVIRVQDFGSWRPLKHHVERGRGLRIMRTFTDVAIEEAPEGNRVVLRRRLS